MRKPNHVSATQIISILMRVSYAHFIHVIHNFIKTACNFGLFHGGYPLTTIFSLLPSLFFLSSFFLPFFLSEEKKRTQKNQSPSCKTAISNTSTLPFPLVSSPTNSPSPLNAPGSTKPTTSHSWPEISCDSTCST